MHAEAAIYGAYKLVGCIHVHVLWSKTSLTASYTTLLAEEKVIISLSHLGEFKKITGRMHIWWMGVVAAQFQMNATSHEKPYVGVTSCSNRFSHAVNLQRLLNEGHITILEQRQLPLVLGASNNWWPKPRQSPVFAKKWSTTKLKPPLADVSVIAKY